MKYPKISSIFIIFIVAHLNLVMPISNASISGDICITDNGIHMAHHSDNQMLHDHRGDTHHSGHKQGINKIKADCNMDMSLSDIYFPGGEHPFTKTTVFAVPKSTAKSFEKKPKIESNIIV